MISNVGTKHNIRQYVMYIILQKTLRLRMLLRHFIRRYNVAYLSSLPFCICSFFRQEAKTYISCKIQLIVSFQIILMIVQALQEEKINSNLFGFKCSTVDSGSVFQTTLWFSVSRTTLHPYA